MRPSIYKRLNLLAYTLVLCTTVLLLSACFRNTEKLKRNLVEPDELSTVARADSFLKAHLNGGHLLVFDAWQLDEPAGMVRGQGAELDLNRDTVFAGAISTHIDSVALFETNRLQKSGAVAFLTMLTGISAVITAMCIRSPKTCFGSCPTFYVKDGDSLSLRAEGFSASIAPSLEDTDVDRLEPVEINGDTLTITMTNEALETHVVRHVNVLAVPKPTPASSIYRDTEGVFYQSDKNFAPAACQGPDGDCLNTVGAFDGIERYSMADSSNLVSKEWIELTFDETPETTAGLILGVRQSLMSTFLLYQTLAYMGEDVGYWLARLERSGLPQIDPMERLLSEVAELEVYVENEDGTRRKVGGVSEYGPLVTDVHLIELPAIKPGPAKIFLHLNKGYWRLDYAGLVNLGDPVPAQRIYPALVKNKTGIDDEALRHLLDEASTLVTFPGDRYEISFPLAEAPQSYAYFLESTGYYLEWIRQEWLADEDAAKVRQIFFEPAEAMKSLAPSFKAIEGIMEEAFWNSRYATN